MGEKRKGKKRQRRQKKKKNGKTREGSRSPWHMTVNIFLGKLLNIFFKSLLRGKKKKSKLFFFLSNFAGVNWVNGNNLSGNFWKKGNFHDQFLTVWKQCMLLDSKLALYNKVSTKATDLLIYCFRSCRILQFNEIPRNKRIDINSAYYVVGTA